MASLSGISQILNKGTLGGTLFGLATDAVAQQRARDQLRAQQQTALTQLQAQQHLSEDSAAQDAALQKAQIAADAASAEERRMAALRKAVARQKTLFSAQGLSGAQDGSSEAVLLGLYNDSTSEGQANAQSDALRSAAIDQNLSQQKQKNLLALAQLQQNQSLERALLAGR
jgi:hypothetical protein